MTEEFAHRVMGKLYGFPQCCVNFYCATTGTDKIKFQPAMLGFRICPVCAREKTIEQLVNEINANRISPKRFPTMPDDSDLSVILADPRWNDEEKIWLSANVDGFTSKPSFEDDVVWKLHEDLAALDAQYRNKLEKEPQRENYLFAEYEIQKEGIIGKFRNASYDHFKQRILDQVRSGTIKL